MHVRYVYGQGHMSVNSNNEAAASCASMLATPMVCMIMNIGHIVIRMTVNPPEESHEPITFLVAGNKEK